MTQATLTTLDTEDRVARIRALAGGRLSAWREAQTTGRVSEQGAARAAVLQGLSRRWHHDLDEQLEEVAAREAAGARRLRRLLGVWLDVSRATAGVRGVLAAEGRPVRPVGLEALLTEDLRALGVPSPGRSAADLVREAVDVVAAEDAAGRVLRRDRRALVSAPVSCRARWAF